MSKMNAFCITINNYTSEHRNLVETRRSGQSELLNRLKKKVGAQTRVMLRIGDETAPSTGTKHLQVSDPNKGGTLIFT